MLSLRLLMLSLRLLMLSLIFLVMSSIFLMILLFLLVYRPFFSATTVKTCLFTGLTGKACWYEETAGILIFSS